MDAEPSGLDDPELAHGRLPLDRDREESHEIPHPCEGRAGMPQDDQARVLLRRVVEDLGEAQVDRDEASLLCATQCRDLTVSRAYEGLLGSRGHVVSSLDEGFPPAWIRVLVELETQAQDAMSIGSTRSRVISAA